MPNCKLTKRIIDTLPAPADRDEIWWDEDLKGLGLKITPTGRRVFLVQYRPAGDRRNPRKYTIGEYGPTTPHQARVEAQRVLAERAAGRDPQAEKQTAKRRIASEQVSDLAAEFIARHVSQNRTAAETARILHREVLPYWGSWTVDEVRKRDVIALLDRVRERGAPIMANRVLAAVRKFFNWCIGRGILEISPCSGVAMPAREQARHRVLTDEELAEILQTARKIGFPFGSIVEVLVVTGQRRDEVGRMAWADLDLDRQIWIVPEEHSKNGKPHIVHLSGPALSLLTAMPRTGELVFSGDGRTLFQGHSKAKRRLDQLSGVTGWTLHDLRRTVASGMARLGVAPHIADKILNHQTGTISGVAAVYQRHEFLSERKDALELWGRHIRGLASGRMAA
ncbi:tyrosine-type recombinase/integrase [Microvirga aerilata]|uniref:Tyrosine-type recombinase/integrase n=1 Tax=Microvirga aerilata TaxID=670292 RepID=A0A936ZN75_9HYPH|nr:site-specific integrase [Microvirga aerilata]MBL0407784.1 tyrosine-type recombinase/integrase [Microvirga aerilata]